VTEGTALGPAVHRPLAREPREGDAFGDMLRQAYADGGAGSTEHEIVERDDGLVVALPGATYFAPPESWSPPARWAVAQARGRVLDVGVGAGRYALEAQRQGCAVTGLDVSPGALEVSGRRGLRRLRHGSVRDVVEVAGDDRYDTVFMLGQNLALMGSPAAAPHVLRDLHRVTAPGGLLVGDSRDPVVQEEHHREYFRFNRSRGRWPGHFTIRDRYRDVATPWFDYFFCTPDELFGLATGTGWEPAGVRTRGATYAVVLRRMD
jgi:SAM-dependent methyltransferase